MRRSGTSSTRTTAFARCYVLALRRHVGSPGAGAAGGERIGRRAEVLGLGALELARIHDRAAAALAPAAPSRRRAESFFASALAPIHAASPASGRAAAGAARLARLLDRCTARLAAIRARLAQATARARAVREKIAAGRRRHAQVLGRSQLLQKQLRNLSHRLLSAQEDERMRISRDLHDAIGETLTGINMGLAALKNEAASDSRELAEAIVATQRLVERSMNSVHRFAWELRPTLLDDLGLVPALRAYASSFAARTGVAVRVAADPRAGELDRDRTTSLFRVAQGALSNVERHARATSVRVTLRSRAGRVRLQVRDDGRGFDAARLPASHTTTHLGLLVMRERVEMVGGTFAVTSSPGRGTVVRADVPLAAAARG